MALPLGGVGGGCGLEAEASIPNHFSTSVTGYAFLSFLYCPSFDKPAYRRQAQEDNTKKDIHFYPGYAQHLFFNQH